MQNCHSQAQMDSDMQNNNETQSPPMQSASSEVCAVRIYHHRFLLVLNLPFTGTNGQQHAPSRQLCS